MSVVYVKLLSGEEIIGELLGESVDAIRVSDPLAMEASVDEADPSRRFVYLSRFAPFSQDRVVEISRCAVALRHEVAPLIADYYTASLDYCRRFGDSKFDSGISQTTDAIRDIVTRGAELARASGSSSIEEDMNAFQTSYLTPSSNTCH